MLLGKPKDKFEVYNDLDDELVNLFRCVRDRPAEFLLELGLLPLNSRTEFGEWLKFHTGRRDPVLFLPTQDVILDNLLPMQQWAEQMKKALHDRADYKEVLQAAAFFQAHAQQLCQFRQELCLSAFQRSDNLPATGRNLGPPFQCHRGEPEL